jgi:hypothetical protein
LDNTIQIDANGATIGGGVDNIIESYADCATIPGGSDNRAGASYAFAAGRNAKAVHAGAFVWADSQANDFYSTQGNQFAVRCGGGVIFTRDDARSVYARWTPGDLGWTVWSDRNSKEGVTPVDPQAVLEKVSRLPLAEWNYKGYPQRHIGPMAQDFHRLFPLNDNDKAIDGGDLPGVALAAIQGLNQKLEEQLKAKEAQLEKLTQRNESLEKRLETLEKLVSTLVQESNGGTP